MSHEDYLIMAHKIIHRLKESFYFIIHILMDKKEGKIVLVGMNLNFPISWEIHDLH